MTYASVSPMSAQTSVVAYCLRDALNVPAMGDVSVATVGPSYD